MADTTTPTAAALLEQGAARLRATADDDSAAATAALDARLLLAHTLGTTGTHISAHTEVTVDAASCARYRGLIERRAAGEPLAYLTGEREFWSLALRVTPAVLVPRPETELLVERALALVAKPDAQVADLGTGSGAVALALARERPRWRIVATDISAAALAVARANAAALGLTLELRAGDWLAPLAGERFDLVASNPPYVAADDAALLNPALAHEPRLALTPGADALVCLRTIARAAPRHLNCGGWLVLEHGAAQGEAVRHELVLAGFRYVRSHHDLSGHERVTEGQYDQI